MEQGQSFTQTIPKDPGAPRPRISTGQVLPFKSDRQGQRVQPITRLFQTPCTAASLTYQVFWQRRAAQSGLSRRRQRNRQDLPDHGLVARDALRRVQERSPRDPVILKGSDVYSEFYGKSTRQLGRFLDYASSVPSVVYIDEFQSFGRKVRGETGAEIEDTRIQDELNRWLDKIVSGKSRTMVIVATNAYEKIREDIRRRLSKVSLNDGVTRDMLLA